MKLSMSSAITLAVATAASSAGRRSYRTLAFSPSFAIRKSPSAPTTRRTIRRPLAASSSTTSASTDEQRADTASDDESSSIYSRGADDLSKLKSPFLVTLRDRGYLHQCTNVLELDEALSGSLAGDCDEDDEGDGSGSGVASAYLGFDATADSLHVGSLLQIMILRHLQKSGHKPIVLLGGGTSKVGDPTGKDESRRMLSEETIASNARGISTVFRKFLSFDDGDEPDMGSTDAYMVDNDAWLSQLRYLDFLRDYGTHFTINRMLNFESVRQRLAREAPLSFLEFNYMILQAYDFLELHRRYGVTLQLGGADQWGNIVSGIELGRRVDGARLFGLTAPLVTTSDGKKMGKTEGGATWLNADKLSEYDYWQFWRNTADGDVVRFLKLFTELPLDRIDELAALEGAAINEAKVVLADEATSMLHGKGCLDEIHETAKSMFSGGAAGGASAASLDSLPRIYVSTSDVDGDGVRFADLFLKLGLASSKKDARRLIAGGGARLGDEKITEETASLTAADFGGGKKELTLRAGKKRAGVVELQ